MYEAESFAPLGLSLRCRKPTACAVGCILTPLRGCPIPPAGLIAASLMLTILTDRKVQTQ
jgi:hypothetical protein